MKNLCVIIVAAILIVVCTFGAYLIFQYSDSHARFNTYEPKICKYADSECFTEALNSLMQVKSEEESSLIMDPLYTLKITIKQGEESPITIDLMIMNNFIHGFKDAVVSKVRGFAKDFAQKNDIFIKLNKVCMIGDYSIKGEMPIPSITGQSNLTFINTDLKMTFSFIRVMDDGETYLNICDLKVYIIPERMFYNFSNLFNGYVEIGYNMNVSENENVNEKSFWSTLSQHFWDVLIDHITNIISNEFHNVPIEKYFAEA